MVLPHIEEVKECFRAGDDAKLLEAFQHLITLKDWFSSIYEWSEENAEECSAFVQRIIPLLPPSTPIDVVLALCDNYLLELGVCRMQLIFPSSCLLISGIVNGLWKTGKPLSFSRRFWLIQMGIMLRKSRRVLLVLGIS